MLDFLEKISSSVQEFVTVLVGLLDSGDAIVDGLNELTFDSTNAIYSFFSTLRYVTGDVIYLAITSFIIAGMTFVLFKLFKSGVNFLLGMIPFVNFKLP